MSNVTNTLTAIITTQEDTTGSVPINRGTGNPAFDCTVGEFVTYKILLAAGTFNVQLPQAVTCQVYIKNLDTANSIQINWTPNNGAPAAVIALNPGEQLILWADPSKATPGITALSFVTAAPNVLCEYFLGG